MIGRRGWMNDPCAPMIIDGKYHLFYQFSPKTVEWSAPLIWGHVVSEDLVHWKDLEDTLIPGDSFDKAASFSGNAVPRGYQNLPTIFYTGVTQLPLDWQGPYTRGSETQNLAFSTDGGLTWQKHPKNPVVAAPPPQFDVTAFRDPFVFESKELVEALKVSPVATAFREMLNKAASAAGVDPQVWFMIVGGGIRHHGGAVFLEYSTDMLTWTSHPVPFYLRAGGTGKHAEYMDDYGWDFEMASVITFDSDSTAADTTSADSGDLPFEKQQFMFYGTLGTWKEHGSHKPFWSAGVYKQDAEGHVVYEPTVTGFLDYGQWYAHNSFWDEKEGQPRRRIAWGWIDEDRKVLKPSSEGGWASTISLPREFFVHTTNNVYFRSDESSKYREGFDYGVFTPDAPSSSLSPVSFTPVDKPGQNGILKKVSTLGIRPATLDILLKGSQKFHLDKIPFPIPTSSSLPAPKSHPSGLSYHPLPIRSKVFHALLTVDFNQVPAADNTLTITNTVIGFTVRQSPDESLYTTILFDLGTSQIRINRSQSIPPTTPPQQKTLLTEEVGYFPLFEIAESNNDGSKRRSFERLELRVVVDRSVVEVFANDRFAMTTRVYTPGAETDGVGIVYGDEQGWIKEIVGLEVDYDIKSIWTEQGTK
ncbi:hypothetical protein HK102_014009 [Quaeritorhiza haematococci]|nr:hypothetical protein HK102_014009 [Quaeritorhiza haematococci]